MTDGAPIGERMDESEKALRKLAPGELADLVGTCKAQIADLDDQLVAYKAEGVRRGLTEAEGKLFRLVLSPPSEQHRIDRVMLTDVFGPGFIKHFSKLVAGDWTLRCFARKRG